MPPLVVGEEETNSHLSEQTTSSSSLFLRKVNIDIVILSTNGLLNERFHHSLSIDHDCVVVSHIKVGSRSRFVDSNSNVLLNLVGDRFVELWPSISVAFESIGRGNTNLVEDLKDNSSIPKHFLQRQVVDANGFAEFDESDYIVRSYTISYSLRIQRVSGTY